VGVAILDAGGTLADASSADVESTGRVADLVEAAPERAGADAGALKAGDTPSHGRAAARLGVGTLAAMSGGLPTEAGALAVDEPCGALGATPLRGG